MTTQRDDLIQALCTDLQPVQPVPPATLYALGWMGLSIVYVVAITASGAPLRGSALEQLMSVPRFLSETLLGLVALGMIAICAFRAAIPGRLNKRFLIVSVLLLVIWLLNYVMGLWFPTLEPSTEGERHACWLEVMLYAIGPMLIALLLTRQLYPLNPWYTTTCFGVAAGLLPALHMQLACMYVIPHVLAYHILPGLVIGLAGSLLALTFPRSGYRTENRR